MHSNVPSVAVVYATLAGFRCRSPASAPSTLDVSWARTGPCTEPRFQEPARSWWGFYLHSSVPSVTVVYATLRRQSTRFRCRSSASSPSTLHVPWARTSPYTEPRFQEPTRSWWGCYLHSSVPSVVTVFATLRRQSARCRCCSPASSPSTLHVSWARTSPCTETRF